MSIYICSYSIDGEAHTCLKDLYKSWVLHLGFKLGLSESCASPLHRSEFHLNCTYFTHKMNSSGDSVRVLRSSLWVMNELMHSIVSAGVTLPEAQSFWCDSKPKLYLFQPWGPPVVAVTVCMMEVVLLLWAAWAGWLKNLIPSVSTLQLDRTLVWLCLLMD